MTQNLSDNIKSYNSKISLVNRQINRVLSDRSHKSSETANSEVPLGSDEKNTRRLKKVGEAYDREQRQQSKNLIMTRMSKEIKVASQACQKLVTGADAVPLLPREQAVNIDLDPGTQVTYKCEVKGLLSPLRFHMDNSQANNALQTLVIYVSATAKEPSEKNHELRISGQAQFKIAAETIGLTKPQAQERVKPKDRDIVAGKSSDPSFMQSAGNQQTAFRDQQLYITIQTTLAAASFQVRYVAAEVRSDRLKERLENLRQERAKLAST